MSTGLEHARAHDATESENLAIEVDCGKDVGHGHADVVDSERGNRFG
jgi:hypothetical protein